MIRAVRGAICAENSKESIEARAGELLAAIFAANNLRPEQIVAITFTCTKDLNAAYPAAAARALGINSASLMCLAEMDVPGSMPKCIRVQVLAETNLRQNEIKHIYLGAAKALRPDLGGIMQIAIDGPSGSGKSTIAKEVAARLGLIYLDTGALYRAAGLAAQNLGADLDDEAAVLAIMDDFEFDPKENSALRTAEAGLLASAVGRHPGVRAKIVKIIQDLAAGQNIIMDGRDIGTVVLPDAPVKIFLTASVEARATRRVHELNLLNQPADFDDIAAQIKARDHQDTTRAASPLKMAEDAQLLDCSEMDINQTVEAILEIIG